MKKRLPALLLLVAVVLMAAPVAMADHCTICRFGNCRPATTGGSASCISNGNGTCTLSGACGGPHPFTEEFFTTEFVVASVERLDEPQQPTTAETRVASAGTETPHQEVRR